MDGCHLSLVSVFSLHKAAQEEYDGVKPSGRMISSQNLNGVCNKHVPWASKEHCHSYTRAITASFRHLNSREETRGRNIFLKSQSGFWNKNKGCKKCWLQFGSFRRLCLSAPCFPLYVTAMMNYPCAAPPPVNSAILQPRILLNLVGYLCIQINHFRYRGVLHAKSSPVRLKVPLRTVSPLCSKQKKTNR